MSCILDMLQMKYLRTTEYFPLEFLSEVWAENGIRNQNVQIVVKTIQVHETSQREFVEYETKMAEDHSFKTWEEDGSQQKQKGNNPMEHLKSIVS